MPTPHPSRVTCRLALEAEDPIRMACCQPHQSIAPPSFRPYAGSRLVIQDLAHFQEPPNRRIACRMVSSLTRCVVIPRRALSSAGSSSVQRPVGYPKSRGLR